MIVNRLHVLALVLATAPASGLVLADEAAAPRAAASPSAETNAPGTGTITGKVVYKSDPKRPWRLGRYYIKNPATGDLAEAVVAISRKGLKGPDAAREPQTATIDQKDFQFTPETIAIRAGDRVKFTNSDPQIHNVQASHARQSFNVNMQPGGEHLQPFPSAGGIRQPYRVGCVFHGAMRSWVYVFDHPWFQVTGADGTFRLSNVPPGEYRLEVAHPAGDLQSSQKITVKAGESTAVEVPLSPDDQPKDKNDTSRGQR
ncbi:MAG: carboxypeptidase regulatory-like domain-containing protein [Deltaproteobacteria bacterium]